MLDFAQNFNVFTPDIKSIIPKNLDYIFRYPDYKHTLLINSISKKFNLDKESIAIGNGATEIIFTLPLVIKKQKIIIVSPTFWEYSFANIERGRKNIENYLLKEELNFKLDVKDLNRHLTANSVVYICNPNNPTSSMTKKEELYNLISVNPDTNFVIDETYLIFREDYEEQSLLEISTKVNNLFVITSLSKIYSVPGLRVGFLAAHPDKIRLYYQNSIPYLTNPLLEHIIPKLLNQDKFLNKTRKFYSKQRKFMFDKFSSMFKSKLKVYEPFANFVLLKILNSQTSTEVVADLGLKGYIARDGNDFLGLGNKWIRTAIRSNFSNEQLFEVLHKIIQ